jgi:hypothetical protein
MKPHGIMIDYDVDVVPLSCAPFGGEVTERHLLFSLTNKLTEKLGKGEPLISFLVGKLGLALSAAQYAFLADTNCDMYGYDLLNILKSSFVAQIYLDATPEEMPPIKEIVAFIKKCGAIAAYCYLGDVEASPTGDKKAQTFEDAHLDTLFPVCKEIGFNAIAYMPSRNTIAQLERVMALCEQYGFMQISGEDINQPRQSFVCKQLKDPRFAHLIDTTWALVGHEISATKDIQSGMFADMVALNPQQLKERIEKYKKIGLNGIRYMADELT